MLQKSIGFVIIIAVFMDVPERLKQLRGKKKLAEFARELGTSHQNIQNYENGRMPSAEFLLLLHAKGINIVWVLTGEGEPYIPPKKDAPQENPQEADMIMVGGFMLPTEAVRRIAQDKSGWRDLLSATMKLHAESPPAHRRILETLISSALQVIAQLQEDEKVKGKAAG